MARRLRIAIDAHALGSNLGGNETYLTGVLTGLQHFPEHDYFLYVTDEVGAEKARELLPGAAGVRVIGTKNPFVRLGYKLPLFCRQDRAEVLHVQYVMPIWSPPAVVMVHDLSYHHHPEWYNKRELLQFRLTIPSSAKRAAHVTTVSEFSRQDLIRTFGIPSERVTVTYNRIDEKLRPPSADRIRETLARYKMEEPYILSLGNLQPRKNLPRLITAWERLRERKAEIPRKLVIVGKRAWKWDEILKTSGASRYASDIVFTGFVPDEDLPALYGGATVFAYPSLFEGFGLPPLEAMACGSAVVSSNVTSLPEVCGEGAELIDPLDVDSIAGAIERLCSDPQLRARRIAAGFKQVESFRGHDLAARTVAAYRLAGFA